MAAISVTYTFLNGQTSDGPAVSQNFTDITTGLSDGTKDLTIGAFSASGTTTLSGRVATAGGALSSLYLNRFGSANAQTLITGTTQGAAIIEILANSGATVASYGVNIQWNSANSSFTTPIVATLKISNATKGASHTITDYAHILMDGSLPTVGDGRAYISDTASIATGSWFIYSTNTGASLFSGIVNCSAGVRTILSTANVTAAAPTDAELDAAFGEPATVGAGFIGVIDDNNDETAGILAFTDGEVWFYLLGTKAT